MNGLPSRCFPPTPGFRGAFDVDVCPPYSITLNASAAYFSDANTPSFEDALYPSTKDFFFEGMTPTIRWDSNYLTSCFQEKTEIWDGGEWTNWALHSYIVPWTFITLYLLALWLLPIYMENRPPIKLRATKAIWNFVLSGFSIWGFIVVMRHLLFDQYGGIFYAGLEASICTHSSQYGCGYSGMAVGWFIFSKCFELMDTIFILLAKRELIFLHWYHHITVLAFCWYSYATRASNGIYFAAVNFGIHAIMYFYYGMTQLGPKARGLVKPYAIYVTFLQLSQMGFGLFIVGMTVYYKYHRRPCFTHPNSNFLALVMYASYFALFLDIFMRRYVFANKKSIKSKRA